MNIKRNIVWIAFVISFLVLVNCRKKQEDTCVSNTTAQVTKVSGPRTISVNQEAALSVDYYLFNGCGNFENIQSISNDNTVVISLIVKYQGCVCTDNLITGQTIFKFKAAQPGIYYLKFLQPNKTYLIDTMTVN